MGQWHNRTVAVTQGWAIAIIEGVNWIDFCLGVLFLAAVPFIFAAYGGHLAAEGLADPKARRAVKLKFWGLCLAGVVIAAVYQYRVGRQDAERERRTSEAQQEARDARKELRDAENGNSAQLGKIKTQLDDIINNPKPSDRRQAAIKLKNTINALQK